MRTLRFIVFGLASIFFSSAAGAGTLYVSINGSGSNCTYTEPCAFINTAMAAADPGDTIVCLTPLRSGSLSITKSITIDCSNVRASMRDNVASSVSGFIGVYINLTSSIDTYKTVRLKGLTIDGMYFNTNQQPNSYYLLGRGIYISNATSVFIEDCVISNMGAQGIMDVRTGGQTRLYIKDTVISTNRGPGIVAASQSPAVTVLDNVSLLNNAYGIAAATGNNVVIARSTISGNTTAGLHADNGAQVNVSNSTLSHNTAHVNAYGTIRLQENSINFSNVAIQGSGARSLGANRFAGNVTLGSAPPLVSGAPADVYD